VKFSELSPGALEKIPSYKYDRIIEKHEGPERWSDVLQYEEPNFLLIEGDHVLLPVERAQHPNITVLRSIKSQDGTSLTLFLKDTTYGDDRFSAGFLAVCDQIRGEDFFLAIVYHEWFIIEG